MCTVEMDGSLIKAFNDGSRLVASGLDMVVPVASDPENDLAFNREGSRTSSSR